MVLNKPLRRPLAAPSANDATTATDDLGSTTPEQLVDDLTDVFLTNGGDMRQMLRAIASHPTFWESRESPRLAHPFNYAIRLMRMLRWDAPWQVGDYLDRSGAGLFDRPTPDGYPEEDSAYADSNALIQRWSLAQSAKWPAGTRIATAAARSASSPR